MNLLSNVDIIGLLVLYFGFLIWGTMYFIKDKSESNFFVANRNRPILEASFSIGASWLWVFALIMAPFFAYLKGVTGLFWFSVPNAIAIGLTGFVAVKLLEKFPKGFTLSQFMADNYSKRVQALYQILFLLSAVYACTMNFTGVGLIFGQLSSTPIWLISGILALGTLAYTWMGGLRASIWSDKWQMILLLVAAVILVPWVIWGLGGLDTLAAGAEGKLKISSLFHVPTMLVPGLLLLILLSASALGEHGYYQRIFAMGGENGERRHDVKKAFMLGSFWFFIVTVAFGLLGMMVIGSGFEFKGNPKVAPFLMIGQQFSIAALLLVSIAVLAALSSTVDTSLNSGGSVVAKDWFKDKDSITISRYTMVVILAVSYGLSILQIDIFVLLLVYGILRVAMAANTVMAITTTWLTERGIFYSLILSGGLGIGINIADKLYKVGPGSLWVAIITLVASIVLSVAISHYDKRYAAKN